MADAPMPKPEIRDGRWVEETRRLCCTAIMLYVYISRAYTVHSHAGCTTYDELSVCMRARAASNMLIGDD